jgi:hypothetical protein
MELKKIPFGTISRFELEELAGFPFPDAFKAGREVELRRLNSGSAFVILKGSNPPDAATVSCPGDNKNFEALILRNWPRLCFISQQIDSKLVVQTHEFITQFNWPDSLPIGLHKNIIDSGQFRMEHLKSAMDVEKWLLERLLLPCPERKKPPRFFLSVGVDAADTRKLKSLRLHGINLTVEICVDEDGRFFVEKVLQQRQESPHMICVSGEMNFTDIDDTPVIPASIQLQLNSMFDRGESFLSIWREYSRLETERAARIASEIGTLRYVKVLSGIDRLTFQIDAKSTHALAALTQSADKEDIVLEADSKEPNLEAGTQWLLSLVMGSQFRAPTEKKQKAKFRSSCDPKLIDLQKLTITLAADSEYPPDSGYLYLSQHAQKAVSDRRSAALAMISSGSTPMKLLGPLLENQQVPASVRQWLDPLTPKSRGQFWKESPTERQRDAIDIAINTPDLAIIQGPPGTGKTQVISAIVKRLEELKDSADHPAGTFLLTSFQHDAVANVAERVTVYGLPPVKTGKRRIERGQGQSESVVDKWRLRTADHVAKIAESLPQNEEARRLRELTRVVASYSGGSYDPARTISTLHQVRELSKDLASITSRERLLQLANKIDREITDTVMEDDDEKANRKKAYWAALALRIDEKSFADDGPRNAKRLFDKLQLPGCQVELSDSDWAILKQSQYPTGRIKPSDLDQLDSIRDELMTQLFPALRSDSLRVAPRIDVRTAMGKVLEEAQKSVFNSGAGLESALESYVHELREDPRRVEEALANYSAVSAETCQGSARKAFLNSQKKWRQRGFETVIVDEAARANPLDLFIPMSQARRRIILVGDQNQLPHNLESAMERELEQSWDPVKLERLKISLFENLFNELQKRYEKDGIKRVVTLDIQFRMHPLLGQFVSDCFYNGKLESGTDPADFVHKLPQFHNSKNECVAAWIDLPSVTDADGERRAGTSYARDIEAEKIVAELVKIRSQNPQLSLGVISFYSGQVKLISDLIAREGNFLENILIGTVDAFQGREFDVVFLSMTRSNQLEKRSRGKLPADFLSIARKRYGFLTFKQRMCVALSRQKKLLVVAGDRRMLDYPEGDCEGVVALKHFLELCEGDYGCIL